MQILSFDRESGEREPTACKILFSNCSITAIRAGINVIHDDVNHFIRTVVNHEHIAHDDLRTIALRKHSVQNLIDYGRGIY